MFRIVKLQLRKRYVLLCGILNISQKGTLRVDRQAGIYSGFVNLRCSMEYNILGSAPVLNSFLALELNFISNRPEVFGKIVALINFAKFRKIPVLEFLKNGASRIPGRMNIFFTSGKMT